MTNIIFRKPLQWKMGVKRTEKKIRSRFKSKSIYAVGNFLYAELRRLNAKDVLITSNLESYKGGTQIYANQKVDDLGVAVYFTLKGEKKAIYLDLYDKVEDNIYGIAKSIECIRSIDRWGGVQVLDSLFTGFLSLPSPDLNNVKTINYFEDCISKEHAKELYRKYCKELHPDLGGNLEEFQSMKKQYDDLGL